EKQGESVERRPYVNRIVCPPASPPYSAACAPAPASPNNPGPSPSSASFAAAPLAFCRAAKLAQTSFQFPLVAAFEYSVARVSKKLACSTPLISGASQGSGWSSTM